MNNKTSPFMFSEPELSKSRVSMHSSPSADKKHGLEMYSEGERSLSLRVLGRDLLYLDSECLE